MRNVLIASQQVRGIFGTGGLGDVPVGLGKELLTRGDVDVRLIMPGFENASPQNRFDQSNYVDEVYVSFANELVTIKVYKVFVPQTKLVCYLLKCAEFDETDRTAALYAEDSRGIPNVNTAPRAILFARAVIEFVRQSREFRVDLVHCNDWNTALVPVYLRTIYANDPYLSCIATLYTIHNAGGSAYQGGFPLTGQYRQRGASESLLSLAELHDHNLFRPGMTESLEHNGEFNFTKGAIAFADKINTVSRRYRNELLTPAFAGGLDGVLAERHLDFTGIINGIDIEEFDPQTNEALRDCHYSAQDTAARVREAKKSARRKLRQWSVRKGSAQHTAGETPFATLEDDSTLLGLVSRIDYQKAPILLGRIQDVGGHAPSVDEDLAWRQANHVINPIEEIAAKHDHVQVVVLGSANDAYGGRFVALLHELRRRLPGKVMFYDGFDAPLSHLIYAATEIFLQPSMFEPCGLTQLAAMRYGAVPIVRAVGGLDDTIVDESDRSRGGEATGFKFKEYVEPARMVDEAFASDEFLKATLRAINAKAENQDRWNQLIANGMNRDSSWTIPAMQYARLYDAALANNLQRWF